MKWIEVTLIDALGDGEEPGVLRTGNLRIVSPWKEGKSHTRLGFDDGVNFFVKESVQDVLEMLRAEEEAVAPKNPACARCGHGLLVHHDDGCHQLKAHPRKRFEVESCTCRKFKAISK